MVHVGASKNWEGSIWGPYVEDPITLGPYWVPLIFGNCHIPKLNSSVLVLSG